MMNRTERIIEKLLKEGKLVVIEKDLLRKELKEDYEKGIVKGQQGLLQDLKKGCKLYFEGVVIEARPVNEAK